MATQKIPLPSPEQSVGTCAKCGERVIMDLVWYRFLKALVTEANKLL